MNSFVRLSLARPHFRVGLPTLFEMLSDACRGPIPVKPLNNERQPASASFMLLIARVTSALSVSIWDTSRTAQDKLEFAGDRPAVLRPGNSPAGDVPARRLRRRTGPVAADTVKPPAFFIGGWIAEAFQPPSVADVESNFARFLAIATTEYKFQQK